MDNSKACTKCGQIKSFDQFGKDKRLKSGIRAQCKKCRYAQTDEWVSNNREQKYASNQRYRNANPEKVALGKRKWQSDNAEKLAAYGKTYRAANREKLQAQSLAWRLANKEKIKADNKAWREKNKERKKANDDAWWRNNPDKVKARGAKRRATKKAASIYLVTDSDIKKIMSKDCFYCGSPSSHLDHVMPLFLGGTHSIGNLVAACQFCNLSKGKKLLSQWRYGK